MLANLRQLQRRTGFVLFMYKVLEMLGKVATIMLPLENALHGYGLRPVPLRALNPLMRMRGSQRRWNSRDLPRIGRTRHLNPAKRPSSWSPFPE